MPKKHNMRTSAHLTFTRRQWRFYYLSAFAFGMGAGLSLYHIALTLGGV